MKSVYSKNKKCALAGLLALLILSGASPVYAQSPEFARTAEEWAVLRDNTLTFEEIPDLIFEYNATVMKNRAEYDSDDLKLKNAEQTKDALLDMADDYESMATEAEGTQGGAMTAASYRMMADQLRQQAQDSTGDGRVLKLNYEKARAEITREAKELFIKIYRTAGSNMMAAKETAYLEAAYASAQNRLRYGMGTQLESLTALEALRKAQADAVTADAESQAVYKRLITLCGWRYDSQAEIGPMPEYDEGTIATADRTADEAAAVANSYTLRIDIIRLENARSISGGSVTQKAEHQLSADTNTVKSAYAAAYDTLMLSKTAFESAKAQYAVQADAHAKADRQLSLGVISRMDYLASENALSKALEARDNAWYDLVTARIDYDAAVAGLL